MTSENGTATKTQLLKYMGIEIEVPSNVEVCYIERDYSLERAVGDFCKTNGWQDEVQKQVYAAVQSVAKEGHPNMSDYNQDYDTILRVPFTGFGNVYNLIISPSQYACRHSMNDFLFAQARVEMNIVRENNQIPVLQKALKQSKFEVDLGDFNQREQDGLAGAYALSISADRGFWNLKSEDQFHNRLFQVLKASYTGSLCLHCPSFCESPSKGT